MKAVDELKMKTVSQEHAWRSKCATLIPVSFLNTLWIEAQHAATVWMLSTTAFVSLLSKLMFELHVITLTEAVHAQGSSLASGLRIPPGYLLLFHWEVRAPYWCAASFCQ